MSVQNLHRTQAESDGFIDLLISSFYKYQTPRLGISSLTFIVKKIKNLKRFTLEIYYLTIYNLNWK